MVTRITRFAVAAGVVASGTVAGFAGQRVFSDDAPAAVGATSGGRSVATYRCPDRDPLGALHRGDRVFITGRNAADRLGWLEIRDPDSPANRVWVRAAQLRADRGLGALPVVACDGADTGNTASTPPTSTTPPASTTAAASTSTTTPIATTTSTVGSPTTTVATRSTTTRPSQPGATTTTVAPPPPPTFGSMLASPSSITENDPGTCANKAYSSTVTVTIPNATSATLAWNLPGKTSGTRAMNRNGNVFSATLGPFPPSTTNTNGQLDVWVTATGPGGSATSQHIAVTLVDCPFFG